MCVVLGRFILNGHVWEYAKWEMEVKHKAYIAYIFRISPVCL